MPIRLSLSSYRHRLRPCRYAFSFSAEASNAVPTGTQADNLIKGARGCAGRPWEDAVLVKDAPQTQIRTQSNPEREGEIAAPWGQVWNQQKLHRRA